MELVVKYWGDLREYILSKSLEAMSQRAKLSLIEATKLGIDIHTNHAEDWLGLRAEEVFTLEPRSKAEIRLTVLRSKGALITLDAENVIIDAAILHDGEEFREDIAREFTRRILGVASSKVIDTLRSLAEKGLSGLSDF